eukprot:875866-Amphidinium_carterae.2
MKPQDTIPIPSHLSNSILPLRSVSLAGVRDYPQWFFTPQRQGGIAPFTDHATHRRAGRANPSRLDRQHERGRGSMGGARARVRGSAGKASQNRSIPSRDARKAHMHESTFPLQLIRRRVALSNFRLLAYVEHMTSMPHLSVRGRTCVMAERCQHALLDADRSSDRVP